MSLSRDAWVTSCLIELVNCASKHARKLMYVYSILLAIGWSCLSPSRIPLTHPLTCGPLINIRAIAMHRMGDLKPSTP